MVYPLNDTAVTWSERARERGEREQLPMECLVATHPSVGWTCAHCILFLLPHPPFLHQLLLLSDFACCYCTQSYFSARHGLLLALHSPCMRTGNVKRNKIRLKTNGKTNAFQFKHIQPFKKKFD